MGYLRNHLATVVMGAFAAVLTGLWPIFVDFAPILDFVFLMAVPIAWFLTFMCWIVQKSVDYSHNYGGQGSVKKNHNKPTQVYTSDGRLVTSNQISEAKSQLGSELDQLESTLKNKDTEIENLKQEISNLKTIVQIESLKTELANLKTEAEKEKNKAKKKK